MAFSILQVDSYGTGKQGTPTTFTTTFNAYAPVNAISANTATIDSGNAYTAAYVGFKKSAKVLFHVSSSVNGDTTHLGKWGYGQITAVNGSVLTLNFDPTEIIPASDFNKYHCQLITVPQFKNLTLEADTTITPLAYSETTHRGGILAFQCSGTFTLNGGHISLTDCGIPASSKDLRPLTPQEETGTLDTDKYSGWENAQTKDRFLLNAGDGAAWIVAKTFTVSVETSRIGNTATDGVQFCRGASDSYNLPANVTNIGGSTVLIAAETINNFAPAVIAKYRSSEVTKGQGLCRAYIASETFLRNDEGLYAYDCLSNATRTTDRLNVRDFGNGNDGNGEGVTTQVNNYATVTAINGAKVSYTNKTTNGFAPIQTGALVMIHVNHKDSSNTAYSGRFFLARVWHDDGTTLTLDALASNYFGNITQVMTNYAVQIVSIPQYNKFTLAVANSATPKFDGAQGGIFAIAVEDACNLSSGKINAEGKGGGSPYKSSGLNQIGNAQNADKLPIGTGHGSVFILANKLVMNANTRIGATYSGAGFGGETVDFDNSIAGDGGYSGYKPNSLALGGSGKSGGTGYGGSGGYGANGGNMADNTRTKGNQGAHIMIIANKITGFNQAAISTGGQGGHKAAYQSSWTSGQNRDGRDGGAGYGGSGGTAATGGYTSGAAFLGGGGGYNGGGGGGGTADQSTTTYKGGGGGSSGWAFIYCNNAVNQDTSGTVFY